MFYVALSKQSNFFLYPKSEGLVLFWAEKLVCCSQRGWLLYCFIAKLLTLGHAQSEAAFLSPGQLSREEYSCKLTAAGDQAHWPIKMIWVGNWPHVLQLTFQLRVILAAWKWKHDESGLKKVKALLLLFFNESRSPEIGNLDLWISFRLPLSIFALSSEFVS